MEAHQTPVLTHQDIKRKAIVGVFALTSRSYVIGLISTIGTLILGALLDPSEFGVYVIASAAINVLNYFSDVGLAGALIQKREEPTRQDLVSTFTIQQLLVGSVVLLTLILAYPIGRFLSLPNEGILLIQSMAIAFFLSSLKTIPSVLLERKLDFTRLIKPQILENFVYYGTAIVCAWMGFGVISYAWATILRGIVGTVTLYIIAPWKPGIGINRENAKRLLAFGIPFQMPAFLALIKDNLIMLFIGKILPLAQVGYIGWAQRIVEMTMRQQIMDNVLRVTFPTYSRLQHDTGLFRKGIEKTLLFLGLVSFPTTIGLLFCIRPLIQVIPQYLKWAPALPVFYLILISYLLAIFSNPFYNALNALGKVKITFGLMLFWTIITWILTPISIQIFGFVGFGVAALLINLTSFLPLILLNHYVQFDFFRPVYKPAFASVGLLLTLILISLFVSSPLLQIVFSVGLGGGVYVLLIYLQMGKEFLSYLSFLKQKIA